MNKINSTQIRIATVLLLISGWAALVYQVLWIKQLSLLFGNSSQAVAMVIAVFFFGSAMGSAFWGNISTRCRSPWRLFGLLEIGIAVSAAICFFINTWYAQIYSVLIDQNDTNSWIFLTSKITLAFVALFIPSFFMGGTMPMISQALIGKSSNLGKNASLLIAANTIGAASGALLTGFLLLEYLGMQTTYLLAITTNTILGLSIIFLLRKQFAQITSNSNQKIPPDLTTQANKKTAAKLIPTLAQPSVKLNHLWFIVFMSGTLTMAVEVLWVRVFSFIIQGSILTHSFIIGTFLCALTAGNLLAYFLYRYHRHFRLILVILLALSAVILAFTPIVFYQLSNYLQPLIIAENWNRFILLLISIVFIPGIILGCIFPFLLKSLNRNNLSAGKLMGRSLLVNTLGALVGPLIAGFVLPSLLGIWNSFVLAASCYALLCVSIIAIVPFQSYLDKSTKRKGLPANTKHAYGFTVTLVTTLSLLIVYSASLQLPIFWLNKNANEEILASWEGSYGAVAVMQAEQTQLGQSFIDRYIRVNNTYTLGGLGSQSQESRQSHLPLLLHPNPQSVYVLGLGTGITAGSALLHDIKSLVVSELVPEVVQASQAYFAENTHHLFNDKRAKIIVDDGRHVLHDQQQQYDVVISDLFLPSVVSDRLYTQQQFELVKSRLNEDGIFCQWLPLYQLTENELKIITATMLSVFPNVTLWRGNYSPNKPVMALIAQVNTEPVNPHTMQINMDKLLSSPKNISSLWQSFLNIRGDYQPAGMKQSLSANEQQLIQYMPYMLYLGNLTEQRNKFSDVMLNSDDKPVVAYQLAKQTISPSNTDARWVIGNVLLDYLQEYQTVQNDPYLANLTQKHFQMIRAGQHYHRSFVYKFLAFMTNDKVLDAQSKEEFKNFLGEMALDLSPAQNATGAVK